MALESPVTRIEHLVATNPVGGDPKSEGDNHLRNIKVAVQGSLPYTSASSATLRAAANNTATCTGTNTLTCGLTPALNAYVEGQVFHLEMAAAKNTGAVTLNIDSKGAGAITWPDGTALIDGDLPASCYFPVIVKDAGTPIFHLLSGVQRTFAIAIAKGSIQGLTYANNGSDATNDIDIAAGGAMDSTGADWMVGAALTKRLDAAWAVGNNQGGILSGSAADVDYNIWQIKRIDTGVVDYGFETTANATPTLPTNYTLYRKIGWFKRVSSAIVPFTTQEMSGGGLRLLWTTPTLDENVSTLGDSRITPAAKVPLSFATIALLRTVIANNSSTVAALVCSPSENDVTPQAVAGQGCTHVTNAAANIDAKDMTVPTSSIGTIAARASAASTIFRFWTLGFEWSRR